MNKTLSIIVAIVVVAVIAIIVVKSRSSDLDRGDSAAQVITIPEGSVAITDGSYNLWEGSFLDWSSRKTIVPDWIDSGTIQVPTGTVMVAGGVPVSGTFDIDMTSIWATQTGKGDTDDVLGQLSDHLKSADWFNAVAYPKAQFTLTRVVPSSDVVTSFKYTVTGDLTIKDIKKEITFDAYIYEMMGKMMIEGVAQVDRTNWDIRFGSGKFFEDLGDNVISDTFTVTFKLATMKN